ncbi:hypothetical protein GCM10025771_39960 [Niveibacterium umoris]|uniref:Uncharacterized protein n=1 Tax=Niveibacterium umoris TaxID=1193620 RepID=A0A840BGS5_9RHOO|nr:hypothetical protein [Niveibacterium umoris]MBB4010802.1 hypothetical protein [Niveibacterium umoris]
MNRNLQIALGITIALTGYAAWKEHNATPDEPVAAASPAAREVAAESQSPPASPERREPGSAGQAAPEAVDLFPAQGWAPPAPPAPKHPPAPAVPTLPFVVAGHWRDTTDSYWVLNGEGSQFLLCHKCDALGRVVPGDTLLTWRLEAIEPREIVFTYLPKNTRQVLPLGEMQ